MCFKAIPAAMWQLRWNSNDKSILFKTNPLNITLTLQKKRGIVKHIQIMLPEAGGTAQTV